MKVCVSDKDVQGVDDDAAHDADCQQPAGLETLFNHGVHSHNHGQVNGTGQDGVHDILQNQSGALEGDGSRDAYHAGYHGSNDHQTHDAADVHKLVHHAALEFGEVLAAHGIAQLSGEPGHHEGGDKGNQHSQNGTKNAALLCQLDAETKGDDADGALEEAVAHAGEGTHKGGLHGVDGIRVEVLPVSGVLLLHGSGQAQGEGAGLGRAVVEGHVPLIGFLLVGKLLRVLVVGVEPVQSGGDAEEEAHVHLPFVVPGVLNSPGTPEELPVSFAVADFYVAHSFILPYRSSSSSGS